MGPTDGGDRYRLRPGVLPDVFRRFSGFFAPRGEARIHAVGLAPQAGQQLFERGHAHLVELEELEHARIGPASEGLLPEHGGDQGQIKLVADPGRAFGKANGGSRARL